MLAMRPRLLAISFDAVATMLATVWLIGCSRGSGSSAGPAAPSSPNPPVDVAAVDVAGTYTLTLTASPSCSTFPDFVRNRSFEAEVTQHESGVSVTVQSVIVQSGYADRHYPVAFPGSIHGYLLEFHTPYCVACTCDEAFASSISLHEEFGMCGSFQATVGDPRRIVGVLDGEVEYYRDDGAGHIVAFSRCPATFTLDRVGGDVP